MSGFLIDQLLSHFVVLPVSDLMTFSPGLVYKKHYPPALNDEVWRLEKIGKDGSFHKRLNNNGIFTVEDFLRLVVRDQQKLRNVSYVPDAYV